MPNQSDSGTGNFFSIPGNIKQRFLPFLIDPSKSINSFDFSSSTAKSSSPQLFTYKQLTEFSNGGTAHLGFYPATSFPNDFNILASDDSSSFLNKDLSFKLLYEPKTVASDGKGSLTLTDIISTIPGVSVREFLPDTRLDQCLNFFRDLFSKTASFMESSKNSEASNKQVSSNKSNSNESIGSKIEDLAKKIYECAIFTLKYMVGAGDASFFGDTFDSTSIERMNDAFKLKTRKDNLVKYIYDFPYILYYHLQSCTTTNVYQVPAMCEGKPIMSSDGRPGWGDGSGFMEAGGIRMSKLLESIPGVGTMVNSMFGNIGVNYMPWWNSESGSKVAAPEITIKFDLFNDNVLRAVDNFIFVNTLVPSNKWIQYNMFQHSSNLYDVKIDGVNRLFACSALFEVTYDGVLRNPSLTFMNYLKKHVNTQLYDKDDFIRFIMSNYLIKIPDVYRVTMTFKSLLPANFNNFLYSYAQNVNHMVSYADNVYDGSYQFTKGISKYVNRLSKVWNSNDSQAGFATGADK